MAVASSPPQILLSRPKRKILRRCTIKNSADQVTKNTTYSKKNARKHCPSNGNRDSPKVSARKLAAELWHLKSSRPRFETDQAHFRFSNGCAHKTTGVHDLLKNELITHVSTKNSCNGILKKMDCSSVFASYMEGATKWDLGLPKALCSDFPQFCGKLNVFDNQQFDTISTVSALRSELQQARNHINDLEYEQKCTKAKIDGFLKKLAHEKASWQSKEHEKVCSVIEAIKNDVNRERKNKQQIEILNSRLVNELSEAKLFSKRYMQDYEKERKVRVLMQDVYNELAKEILEDKAEVEYLKREFMRFGEEKDEERRMLQMAEVWREERVQMKLINAKLKLEEKYMELIKLQANMEAFLRSHQCPISDDVVVNEDKMVEEAYSLVKVQDVNPPASEDIHVVFEELRLVEEAKEKDKNQNDAHRPTDNGSKAHSFKYVTDVSLGKAMERYVEGRVATEVVVEDESEWETESHIEEQASCNSPEMSDQSLNGNYEESHASVSGTEWDEAGNIGVFCSEMSGNCSRTGRRTARKVFSIGRLRRSSCPADSIGANRKSSSEFSNGRLSNSRISNASSSLEMQSGNTGLSSPSVNQQFSPKSLDHSAP